MCCCSHFPASTSFHSAIGAFSICGIPAPLLSTSSAQAGPVTKENRYQIWGSTEGISHTLNQSAEGRDNLLLSNCVELTGCMRQQRSSRQVNHRAGTLFGQGSVNQWSAGTSGYLDLSYTSSLLVTKDIYNPLEAPGPVPLFQLSRSAL